MAYIPAQYRLLPGKMTAFDTDIHVPLLIAGPGIRPDRVSSAMVQNVDLAKTFAAMAGTSMPSGDGHSLLGLLHGASTSGWRNAILVEHRGPNQNPLDPDFQSPASGNPTTYRAMRTRTFLYVEYRDGEREFYDLRNDPFELHNLAGSLSVTQLARLHRELARLARCRRRVLLASGRYPQHDAPMTPGDAPFTSAALAVRRAVFEAFAATGMPPLLPDSPERRFLADRHVIVLGADGQIEMAHPFAAHRRGTRVDADGRTWWGNCAWDGFGITACLGLQDARVTSGGITVSAAGGCPGGESGVRPPGEAVFHVLVPARHWWDDIGFT